jgi:hypothetical protein
MANIDRQTRLDESLQYMFTLTLGRDYPEGEVDDTQLQTFLDLVAGYLEGFTVTHSVGYWKREQERSFSISVAGDSTIQNKIVEISNIYKALYQQEATMLEIRESGIVEFL